MNNYDLLKSIQNQPGAELYIMEKGTGASGIASLSEREGFVYCFYGSDDGSDDKELSIEEFNNRFLATVGKC